MSPDFLIFPAFSKKNPRQLQILLFSHGKNRISQGAENRGSLISVPLALRDYALLLAEIAIYTTTLHHDAGPVCIAMAFAEVLGSGVVGTPPKIQRHRNDDKSKF